MEKPASSPQFNATTFLVTLLVIAAFFLGSLWTKVELLEKTNLQAAGSPTGFQPEPAASPSPLQANKTPVITTADHVRGNKKARITLVEYSDLECPFCKRFHPTMQQIVKEYGDQVKWVYRHYPLSFHQNAQKEAEASECVAKLGGNDTFWGYIDKILERTTSNGTGFALDQLAPLAVEVGVNEKKFTACLDSEEFTKKIKDQIANGSQEGVTGTPGTIIVTDDGKTQLIPGALPYDQVKTMIDSLLQS